MNLQIQCFLYNLVNVYRISLNKRYSKLKGQSRMDNPEKTNGANQEWTIHRKPKGQSRMDNPEILASLVKQDTGRRRTKHNT